MKYEQPQSRSTRRRLVPFLASLCFTLIGT
nr:Iporin [Chilli leaf curl virus]